MLRACIYQLTIMSHAKLFQDLVMYERERESERERVSVCVRVCVCVCVYTMVSHK